MPVFNGDGGKNTLKGGTGNDTLNGMAGDDSLLAGAGNDQLKGDDGNDSLSGDAGNDTLDAGSGSDLLVGGLGDDVLKGGTGNDRYLFGDGFGEDTLTDTNGVDTIVISTTFSFLSAVVDLPNHVINSGGNAIMINSKTLLENFLLTPFNDIFTGNSLANLVDGDEGNDSFNGGGGNDTLLGGEGNDSLSGSSGADVLDGGDGNNVLQGGSGNDKLSNGGDNETLNGGAGDDVYIFDAFFGTDTVIDSGGTDTLDLRLVELDLVLDLNSGTLTLDETESAVTAGLDTMERVFTAGGNDEITANGLNNYIVSASGEDTVSAGGGNDTLLDGLGADRYEGGAGNDLYIFKAENDEFTEDVIADSAGASDRLWMQGFSTANFFFSAEDANSNDKLDDLLIQHESGTWQIRIVNYFDDTEADVASAVAGIGCLESLSFSDDNRLTFSELVNQYL